MGNIAYRVGQSIHWDDSSKKFKEPEADKLTRLNYNPNWQLPAV
jgi:hypothetical protein